MLFQNLKNTGIVGIRELPAAGADRGGGREGKQRQLLRVLRGQLHQLVVQNALDAVDGAVDLARLRLVHRLVDHAEEGSVNDGGGAAAVRD